MARKNAPPVRRACMYCGSDSPSSREHVIPDAIGGTQRIKAVCETCNSGILSELDRELCSRSHLAVIASQELAADLWQLWDVDHAADDLLVEAKPLWGGVALNRLCPYPQLTAERHGPALRGDTEQVERFGRHEFSKVMTRAIRAAYHRFCAGEPRSLHLERVESPITQRGGYRLAPRVFTRHSICEIARKIDRQSFIVRFASQEDLRRLLLCLSRLDVNPKFGRWGVSPNSRLPTIASYFDSGLVVRALTKLGLNLLGKYCSNTHVGRDTFGAAVRLVLGQAPVRDAHIKGNGFVRCEGVQDIAKPGCHTFRLVHMDGHWLLFACFFGGRIGAAAAIPGPNLESWNTLNVEAPIDHTRPWRVTTSPLINFLKVQVEWLDSALISPSLEFQRSASSLIVEDVPTPRANRAA